MKISIIGRLAGLGTAIAAASLLSATMITTASATGVLAGAGTAKLPTFPCPAGCAGTASLTGVAISTSNGHGVGTITADYVYVEPNGLTCPAVGTADGNIAGAGLAAHFTWARTGLVALVHLDTVTVNGGAEPNGTVVAVFAPAPTPPLSQPGGCDNTATASGVTAVVAAGGTL